MKENLSVAHSDCIAALTLAPRGEDTHVPLQLLVASECRHVTPSLVRKLEKKDVHFLRNSSQFFRRAASLGLATTV